MMKQAPFQLRGRNPDVLTCIANLSNDEVFTPSEFANRMTYFWTPTSRSTGAHPEDILLDTHFVGFQILRSQ